MTIEEKMKSKRFQVQPDSNIDYGYFSSSHKPKKQNGNNFYLTTAINYTNGPAHMGHAYEAITSDAIARYSRVLDNPTWFLTGADEHGQKIANAAMSLDSTPQSICDLYVNGFRNLLQRTLVSNNDYVRTSSARHKKVAQALWDKCAENGDIYLSSYEGWYLEREETFVTDSDALLWNHKDPVSGVPLKKVSEESYFFRMSKYHKALLDHINKNPSFIEPAQHRNNILKRLESDDLRDLSISRTSFSWGIPVPEKFDAKHVMYVWVDALSNYLTGVDALGLGVGSDQLPSNTSFWPANVHVIGKDILWFHTVIWPCLLMSAGLPLPKQVFAHGFVNDIDGRKMSKSLGNVIDPHDMLDIYPVDTFRWYLCKEAAFGSELSFSQMSIRLTHNADLADVIGNLVHRVTNLCKKYCGGVVVDVKEEAGHALPFDFEAMRKEYIRKMDVYELEGGCNIAIQGFRDTNLYLTNQAPWHLKGDENSDKRQLIVRNTLEAVFSLAHLLAPFLVNGVKAMFQKLNTDPIDCVLDVKSDLRNLAVGTKVDIGDILYAKIEDPSAAKEQAKTQEKKKQPKPSKKSKNQDPSSSHSIDFTKIDIRVGRITKIWPHPDADKLFCEEIDVGEEAPRQIASGLRPYYSTDELLNSLVLVVCNLKPQKLVGFESNGMILAAKGDEKTEIVQPPLDSKIGQRVTVEKGSVLPPALTSTQVKKKKVFDSVQKDLKVVQGKATWKDKVIVTSEEGGECAVKSLSDGVIS